MKILLIGPYPPPHGGISVHVIEARKQLLSAGEEVFVLNTNRGAPASAEYLSFRWLPELVIHLVRYSLKGWVFHVHTNGHNGKSWLLALLCGLIGKLGQGQLLTLHSGMAPTYLQNSSIYKQWAVQAICRLFDRVVAVNADIFNSLLALGVPKTQLEIFPAYLSTPSSAPIPAAVESFLKTHQPVFTTVLFFRPEYGVEFLLKGLVKLRQQYPNLGCIFLGEGERCIETRMAILRENIGDSILLLGDVPHDLCLTLMARSDAFLRCTFADGDSISVREALAAGVPVIASAVGYRPPGVAVFPAGNLNAFIERVVSVLASERRQAPVMSCTSIPRLVNMYRSLQPGELRT